MKILVVGDIVGEGGVKKIQETLPKLKKENNIDFVIVNGENSADGMGITQKIFNNILASGANTVTMGNHTWGKKDIFNFIDNSQLLVPANYPRDVLGNRYGIYECNGKKIGIINLLGRTDMNVLTENPFLIAEDIINKIKGKVDIIIIDFHAEATAEKIAMGHYLSDKVNLVFGTHTHVQTADETILKTGMAYITDVGMVGPSDSVLGLKKEIAINRFLTGNYIKYECSNNKAIFNAIIVEFDDDTKKAISIKRVNN